MSKFTWSQWQEMKGRTVTDMSDAELREEIEEHNRIRAWSSRYYAVQREWDKRCNIVNNRRAVTGTKDYENQ